MLHTRTRKLALATCLSVACINSAQALEVLSTMPAVVPDEGGPCIGDPEHNDAIGFAPPDGETWQLDSVTVALHDVSDVNGTPFDIDLHSDDGGVPGAVITNLGSGAGTWNGTDTHEAYTINVTGTVEVEGGETYWMVVNTDTAEDDSCLFGWIDDGEAPVGNFTLVGEAEQSDGSPWTRDDGELRMFAINATMAVDPVVADADDARPVPALPAWGIFVLSSVLAAGGWVAGRRRKRR